MFVAVLQLYFPFPTQTLIHGIPEPKKAVSAVASVPIAKFYGSLDLDLPVDAAMSPRANILVYYVAADGEIVSDSMQFDVETCTANKVQCKDDIYMYMSMAFCQINQWCCSLGKNEFRHR